MEQGAMTLASRFLLRRRFANVRDPEEEYVLDEDVDSILGSFNVYREAELRQAAYLANCQIFTTWLLGGGSCLIVVQLVSGTYISHRFGTAMSGFCATLSRSLAELAPRCTSPTIVLHFFCAAHVQARDPFVGPQGMMRFLIYQLLSAYPVQFWPTEAEFEEELALYDTPETELEGACRIFMNLLLSVPPDWTVFCIIDGISAYDRSIVPGRIEAMITAIEYLNACVTYADCRFRVMLTHARDFRRLNTGIIPQENHYGLGPGQEYPLDVTPAAMIGTWKVYADPLTFPSDVAGSAP